MSPAQEITRHFKGEWRGNEGFIPTPGHSAKDRGTTVRDKPDGDVVFHSFNGGDWQALKDECRAKGLLPDRDGRSAPRSRDVAAWEYTDADGTVLYRKVRMARPDGSKSYRFEHPDGQGGWKPKRGNAPQVPYRLPDLVTAPRSAIIYMAEGEKQADKLAGWGLVATSSKDWRSFDFSGYVKGRTVVILPDNDEEGARVAKAAQEAVERAEGRAVLVELPGLPPKGDIMDWPGDVDQLLALADAALNPPETVLPLIDIAAWTGSRAPARQWLVEDWIPRKQTTMLTGAGGVGKSLLAQQLCTCVALGLPFMGQRVERENVLYVSCEDDADELWRRQEAICQALGVSLADVVGKLFLVSLVGATDAALATFTAEGRLKRTSRWRELVATMDAHLIGVVAFDNATDAMAGDLNDLHQVAEFVMMMTGDIAMRRGGAALIIHHPNKKEDEWLGSVAWHNKVRSRLFLSRPADADPDARELINPKANYGPSGATLSFRWAHGAFLRAEDVPEEQRCDFESSARAAVDNAIFLACLRERAAQGEGRGVGPTPGPNYAPAQFEGMAQAKRLKRDRLKLAMDRLFTIGVLETYEHRVPGKGRSVTLIREVPNAPELGPRTGPEHSPRTPPNHTTERPRTHSLGTAYHTGAADGVAAPNGRMILAPGETGDDVELGLEA